MSSDLLAEFDSFYKAPQGGSSTGTSNPQASQPSNTARFSFFDPPSTTANVYQASQATHASKKDDDIWGNFNALQIGSTQPVAPPDSDPWGSFETSVQPSAPGPVYTHNTNSNLSFGATKVTNQPSTKHETKPVIQRVRAPTLDLFSSTSIAAASTYQTQFAPQHSAFQAPIVHSESKTNPADVLFDADEEFDDDDFGDFETVSAPASFPVPAPVPAQAPLSSAMDLLMDSPPKARKVQKKPEPVMTKASTLVVNSFPYPQAPKSPSFQERNPFSELAVKTRTSTTDPTFQNAAKRDSPVTAWPTYVATVPKATPYEDSPVVNNSADDDWGDFADLPPDPAMAKPTTGIEADARAWDTADNVQPVKVQEVNAPPPTNIPPPSVLLAAYAQLFDLPQSALFKPVSNQTHSIKNRILSDPTTITFLRSYIALATVCAHIIAGRKLCWKRDTILAQAMKIGPSAAGGKGGMKLTGVDKTEATREEREASDVVRIWHEQVGRLRSATAAANASLQNKGEHLVVPEISENMTVKTEGGLSAPKPCVLCGLKREERVAKVHINVEDSFGEWWVEHWGHRLCRNFWEEHEAKLRGR